MTTISAIAQKQAMRAAMREKRAVLRVAAPDAPQMMAKNFLAAIDVAKGATVSGFWPIGDEADPLPLLGTLRARGHAIALPRIAGAKRTPLAFHIYGENAALVPGRMGLSEPGADWTIAIPSVVIVPLLAFDARGHRLGYGAGYYDATLSDLRRGHDIVAVGYAYAGQEVPEVPHDVHDQALDWVVTETGARRLVPGP
jgi:5-formyltetrahydrofolate cyclo-ligase